MQIDLTCRIEIAPSKLMLYEEQRGKWKKVSPGEYTPEEVRLLLEKGDLQLDLSHLVLQGEIIESVVTAAR